MSGGQKTRAFLARILLEEPDILLLDEPTNHLDLDAIEWLEGYLKDFKKSMIVVSHDRYFLDQCVSKIWEISYGEIETYRGNYSSYMKQREERYTERMRIWEAQQRYIEETQEFIRRFLAGQRSKEAQGRRSILERFIRDEAIRKPRIHEKMRMRLQPSRRTGDLVLQLKGLTVGYSADKPLLKVPEMEIRRDERHPPRIALVGPNGAGKTTLLRTLLGDLKALEGEVRWGTNVDLGYLSQAHYDLDPELDVLNAIRWVKEGVKEEEARSYMGNFLFSGDDAFKKLGSLSGGQRSRVALARLAMRGSNILLLDEPTNHLDLVSQEILQDVLVGFPGIVIFVSHDRFLVQGLANLIWVVDEGTVQQLDGGWSRYLDYRADRPPVAEEKPEPKPEPVIVVEAPKVDPAKKKAPQKLLRKIGEAEAEIQILEARLKELSNLIEKAGTENNQSKMRELGSDYSATESKLRSREEEWTKMGEELQQYASTE